MKTFTPTRRAALALALVAPLLASAADFPTKPIRFIVPYSAGGTTDLVARTVGQRVGEKLGQPVVIDNRGGAGGNIGMDAVAKAPADGYTIGFGAISTNALNPHIYKSMAFDPRKDFTAIGLLGTSTIVLEVPASSPIKSVPELIAAAKKTPGLPYATAGAGTSMNLAGVMFAQMTGTQLTHVAYKGSGPAITDMLGGTVGIMFDNLPASLPHIQAGRLRALAVSSPQPVPDLPGVPTLRSLNYPALEVQGWAALLAPKGTIPAEGLNRLSTLLMDALASETVKTRFAALAVSPVVMNRQASGKFLEAEAARYAGVIKARGIKAG